MSPRLTAAARWAGVIAAPALVLGTVATPAAAASVYTVNLHQPPPLTATGDGVEQGDCPDSIPADKDGWHFVLPTNDTVFVKLTVTFEPGGQQVITKFGPPSDKHAYVASPAGAKLTSAVADVSGGSVKWFNLSHTCPAKPTTPPTSKPPTSKPPTTAPATSKPPTEGTPSPSTGTMTPPSSSVSPSSSNSVLPTVSATAGTGGSSDGSLAQTGAFAVGGILAVAAALVGGGFLLRRWRGGTHAA